MKLCELLRDLAYLSNLWDPTAQLSTEVLNQNDHDLKITLLALTKAPNATVNSFLSKINHSTPPFPDITHLIDISSRPGHWVCYIGLVQGVAMPKFSLPFLPAQKPESLHSFPLTVILRIMQQYNSLNSIPSVPPSLDGKLTGLAVSNSPFYSSPILLLHRKKAATGKQTNTTYAYACWCIRDWEFPLFVWKWQCLRSSESQSMENPKLNSFFKVFSILQDAATLSSSYGSS